MTGPEAPARPNVLLVDDVPANLVALEAILEPLGARCVRASSGLEALERLLHDEFALILMDVQMPDLDGVETARLIKRRERTRHVPIIFVTAISRDMAHVFQGYDTGAVDYLMKPIDPVILRAKVGVFLELHRNKEEVKRQAALLRRREREALERRSQARYRRLTNSIPHAVLIVDREGRIGFSNDVWKEIIAAEPVGEEAPADGLLVAVNPEDRATAEPAWRAGLAGDAPFELQLRLRCRKPERWCWYLVRAVPERDDGGAIRGWIVTATDIDERRRAEEALREAVAGRDRFLSAASHELRTPLTSAKLLTQQALRSPAAAQGGQLTDALRGNLKQIERMTSLVEKMLDLSRIETGHLPLERRRFDLARLAREVGEQMQAVSSRHIVRVHGPERLEVDADPDRIDQVLTNLVSNAIRYSPDGGPIDITLEQDEASVGIAVRDVGLGVEEAKQGLIFERFGQAHGINYGGLGLGLTIARGIVEQHGGRISVESSGRRGEGSTFRVELPRFPAAAEGPAGAGAAAAPAHPTCGFGTARASPNRARSSRT